MSSSVLITGVTGQDGSYLAEFLLSKGYRVHGLVRPASSPNLRRIEHLLSQSEDGSPLGIQLHQGDLLDSHSLSAIVAQIRPDEIYNLGAHSFVSASFQAPIITSEVNALGTLRLLEAIRLADVPARFYQAGSSEMFGRVLNTPQDESTPFNPRSPYAASKVFAHHVTREYRDAYGMFACNGILFNHESPRRGLNFVTRKLTYGLARILAGKNSTIRLGNLEAKRDWGYARDYVEAMWLMLQRETPDDYVIATGRAHTVRELAQAVFSTVSLDWREHIRTDPALFRPNEVDELVGNPDKAVRTLGWSHKTNFRGLIDLMVASDLVEVGVDLRRWPHLESAYYDNVTPIRRGKQNHLA